MKFNFFLIFFAIINLSATNFENDFLENSEAYLDDAKRSE